MPLTELFLSPDRFVLFVLVLTRISGVVMVAPVLGTRAAPPAVRVALAMGLTLLVLPSQLEIAVQAPATMAGLLVVMLGEAIIGLSIGLGIMILFSGIHLAGNIIGQMSGAQVADIFDPTFNQSVPIYAQLFDVIAMAVFVIIGGHREVIDALLATFQHMPLGGGGFNAGIADALVNVVTLSFSTGIRAAAPAMVALLLAVLILSLLTRTLPQLNIFAVGFNVYSMVAMSIVSITLGGIIWAFQDEVTPALDMIQAALYSAANSEPSTAAVPN